MIVLGITGGIGSGKTTASEYLEGKGFPRIDVDEIGRELTADGQPVLEIIRDRFGCVNEGGNSGNGLVLDRRALAGVIFNDDDKLAEFNEIIHTRMIRQMDRDIADYREIEAKSLNSCTEEFRAVLLDAPLLFEANIEDRCDKIILITADMETRIRRVAARDGANEKDIRARIASQMSDEEKAKLSDFVVDNSGKPCEMFRQLDEIAASLK